MGKSHFQVPSHNILLRFKGGKGSWSVTRGKGRGVSPLPFLPIKRKKIWCKGTGLLLHGKLGKVALGRRGKSDLAERGGRKKGLLWRVAAGKARYISSKKLGKKRRGGLSFVKEAFLFIRKEKRGYRQRGGFGGIPSGRPIARGGSEGKKGGPFWGLPFEGRIYPLRKKITERKRFVLKERKNRPDLRRKNNGDQQNLKVRKKGVFFITSGTPTGAKKETAHSTRGGRKKGPGGRRADSSKGEGAGDLPLSTPTRESSREKK